MEDGGRMSDFPYQVLCRAQGTEPRGAKSPLALAAVPEETTRDLAPRCPLSHCSCVIKPTICFLFPKGETPPSSSLTQTGELKGHL